MPLKGLCRKICNAEIICWHRWMLKKMYLYVYIYIIYDILYVYVYIQISLTVTEHTHPRCPPKELRDVLDILPIQFQISHSSPKTKIGGNQISLIEEKTEKLKIKFLLLQLWRQWWWIMLLLMPTCTLGNGSRGRRRGGWNWCRHLWSQPEPPDLTVNFHFRKTKMPWGWKRPVTMKEARTQCQDDVSLKFWNFIEKKQAHNPKEVLVQNYEPLTDSPTEGGEV